jgi:hypothetical protein
MDGVPDYLDKEPNSTQELVDSKVEQLIQTTMAYQMN